MIRGPTLQRNPHSEGVPIHAKDEMISLTDMWRAAGSDPNKPPTQWHRHQMGQKFISFVAANLKCVESHVISIRRGRNGGTWGHWQVAMAYAKYLSPEFHVWCNAVVRVHMEGKSQRVVPALDSVRRQPIRHYQITITNLGMQ